MSEKQTPQSSTPAWMTLTMILVSIVGFGVLWNEVHRLGARVEQLSAQNSALSERLGTLLARAPGPGPGGMTGPAGPGPGPGFDGMPEGAPPPGDGFDDEPPGPEDPEEQFNRCRGRLTPDDLHAAIAEHAEALHRCSTEHPDVRGMLNLDILLDDEGAINGARVSGEVQDRATLECVMDAFHDYRFPVPEDEECSIAIFHIPFPFEDADS